MNILFFVIFPVSVILISIVLQKVLNSPLLVSILVFAVFLILSYTVYTRFNWNNCSGICNNENNGLQDSIDTLEDNINTLNELLSNLINNEKNNGCGCNRRIRR